MQEVLFTDGVGSSELTQPSLTHLWRWEMTVFPPSSPALSLGCGGSLSVTFLNPLLQYKSEPHGVEESSLPSADNNWKQNSQTLMSYDVISKINALKMRRSDVISPKTLCSSTFWKPTCSLYYHRIKHRKFNHLEGKPISFNIFNMSPDRAVEDINNGSLYITLKISFPVSPSVTLFCQLLTSELLV